MPMDNDPLADDNPANDQTSSGFTNTTESHAKSAGSMDGADVQDERGYEWSADGNPKDAGTDSPYINEARGYVHDEKARALPTRRINDRVKGA